MNEIVSGLLSVYTYNVYTGGPLVKGHTSHHQLTEQPKVPCTHSATTTTNLTAVFKS